MYGHLSKYGLWDAIYLRKNFKNKLSYELYHLHMAQLHDVITDVRAITDKKGVEEVNDKYKMKLKGMLQKAGWAIRCQSC